MRKYFGNGCGYREDFVYPCGYQPGADAAGAEFFGEGIDSAQPFTVCGGAFGVDFRVGDGPVAVEFDGFAEDDVGDVGVESARYLARALEPDGLDGAGAVGEYGYEP